MFLNNTTEIKCTDLEHNTNTVYIVIAQKIQSSWQVCLDARRLKNFIAGNMIKPLTAFLSNIMQMLFLFSDTLLSAAQSFPNLTTSLTNTSNTLTTTQTMANVTSLSQVRQIKEVAGSDHVVCNKSGRVNTILVIFFGFYTWKSPR